ncbi:hypothetical protein L1987_18606 [Smallanthus sonchifolius]|uniref:Uncharacterized protein n=1 Tax=Smallanthus sonchifolius TaxID=185202 RepID=A0ACB9J2D8_9ASTR|nr:hypothetical protein L1987_18606 [Smallanthus sonchifolius]
MSVVKSKLLMICLSTASMFDADEKPISSNFGLQKIRLSAGNLFISRRTQLSVALSLICSNFYKGGNIFTSIIGKNTERARRRKPTAKK